LLNEDVDSSNVFHAKQLKQLKHDTPTGTVFRYVPAIYTLLAVLFFHVAENNSLQAWPVLNVS
jgi:hypothetical protein